MWWGRGKKNSLFLMQRPQWTVSWVCSAIYSALAMKRHTDNTHTRNLYRTYTYTLGSMGHQNTSNLAVAPNWSAKEKRIYLQIPPSHGEVV